MFDIVGKRRWYFLASLVMTVPGFLFIALTPITGGSLGLQFSIDYTGGTRWEIRFEDPEVTADQIRDVLADQGLPGSSVVATSGGFYEIKTIPIGLVVPTPTPTAPPTGAPSASPSGSPGTSPAASPAASPTAPASPATTAEPSPTATPEPPASGNTDLPTEGRIGEIARALQAEIGPIAEQRSLTTIGPVVSADLIRQAIVLILFGSVGILVWMTIRFRDVKFGVTAIIALVHDVIVVVGLFAILGTLFGVEVDALFVTAMLTVIGFSVHDTIVVFDRVRENKARHVGEPFAEIVNHSLLQTLGRSLTTSFTVVVVLIALLLFGGAAISNFILALLIGIVAGTYSSICVASPLLVVWQEREDRRRRRSLPAGAARRATP